MDRILQLRSRGIRYVTEIKNRRRDRERRSQSLCEVSEFLSPIKQAKSAEFLFLEGIQGHSSLIDREKFEKDLQEISFQDPEEPIVKEELLLSFFADHSVLEESCEEEEDNPLNITFED